MMPMYTLNIGFAYPELPTTTPPHSVMSPFFGPRETINELQGYFIF